MDELTTINVTVGRLSKEEDWAFKDSAAKWMPVFQTRHLPNMLSVVSYIECIILNWIRGKNIVNHAQQQVE